MGSGRTQMVRRRLEDVLEYRDGVPYFKGRRLIEEDSPIDRGIYPGGREREAIVVDYDRSIILRVMYSQLDLSGDEDHILKSVYDIVDEVLEKKSTSATNELLAAWGCAGNDKRVNLDKFLAEGVGVCRHSALACGVLIEKLIEQNVLKGKVSIGRNTLSIGTHGWCKYEDENGKRTVLDPIKAGGYLGPDDSLDAKWIYLTHKEMRDIYVEDEDDGFHDVDPDNIPADVKEELAELRANDREAYKAKRKEVVIKFGGQRINEKESA